jgi:hypothetical protein
VVEISRDRDISLNQNNIHNVSTQITGVEVIQREPPLGEIVINVQVRYTYKKGVV